MIRPLRVSSRSAFLEQQCALCKETFVPGDDLVICPEDGARHHAACWQANGYKCSAFGCPGKGQISNGAETTTGPQTAPSSSEKSASKVRVMPSSSLGCGQSCLLLSIAAAIIIMAIACFGLWAIADYLMLNVYHLDYRTPLGGMILPLQNLLAIYF